jgi:chromosome segregation ATPase
MQREKDEMQEKMQREKDEMQREVDELKAELAKSRKRQREADDNIKVKLEKVEEAVGERGRARKRARRAESKAQEAERRADEAEERGQCGVCLERDADTLLQPCGIHRVCGECAAQLTSCPSGCPGVITGRQKTFA